MLAGRPSGIAAVAGQVLHGAFSFVGAEGRTLYPAIVNNTDFYFKGFLNVR